MRLTDSQTTIICNTLLHHFGQGTQAWLFGSRVDEQRKGGDIDLYLEPELQDPAVLVDAKLHCLVDLHKQLGERKIDLVICRKAYKETLPIFNIALEQGVKLL
jgi:hypothetical protein